LSLGNRFLPFLCGILLPNTPIQSNESQYLERFSKVRIKWILYSQIGKLKAWWIFKKGYWWGKYEFW
jgi:hypothetical protein